MLDAAHLTLDVAQIKWGPIANASLRIMNGYADFYIRDCKTLHRDWFAIDAVMYCAYGRTSYYIIAFYVCICLYAACLCAGFGKFFPTTLIESHTKQPPRKGKSLLKKTECHGGT